jgi:hypothetical protein
VFGAFLGRGGGVETGYYWSRYRSANDRRAALVATVGLADSRLPMPDRGGVLGGASWLT